MQFRGKKPSLHHYWDDLTLARIPDNQQLEDIKNHLDLILLALEAIAGIGSEAILPAAQELNLEEVAIDRIKLWRLPQSNPLEKSARESKNLDVEETRSLVLIIARLAKQHRELLRRAVALLEQMTAQNQFPHKTQLLGDYLDNFTNIYQERIAATEGEVSPDLLSQLAFKLLVDLLFLSANNGHRRLWLALLDYSK